MKWLFGVPIFFFACQGSQTTEHLTEKSITTNSSKSTTEMTLETDNELFPEYFFTAKDTIKDTDFNASIERIKLGTLDTDSTVYTLYSELRTISITDGNKARSIIELQSKKHGNRRYEFNMPKDLPVDIYKNHLVFIDENKTYHFAHIDTMNEELICFSHDNSCALRL